MAESRDTLRRHLRAERKALPVRTRQKAVANFTNSAFQWIGEAAGKQRPVIAGYMPIEEELDILPLLERLHEAGFELCLPVIPERGRTLTFRRWQPGDRLVSHTRYGIEEPETVQPARTPDWLLVPLVAFDAQGNRLGFGGGYYDATLQQLRQHNHALRAIGCAYGFQQVAHLPPEPHDQPMDRVLTESTVLSTR